MARGLDKTFLNDLTCATGLLRPLVERVQLDRTLDLQIRGASRRCCTALLHGSERGRIGPLSGSLGVSASDSGRFRHPELSHAIEDVHTDHRFPPLPFFGP